MFKYFDNTVCVDSLEELISMSGLLGLYTLENRDYLIENSYIQSGFNINDMLYWPKDYIFILYNFIKENFANKELPNLSDFDTMFSKYYTNNKDSELCKHIVLNVDSLLKDLFEEEISLDIIVEETNMEKIIIKNNICGNRNSFITDYDKLDKISKELYNECFGEKGFKSYRINEFEFKVKEFVNTDTLENVEYKDNYMDNEVKNETIENNKRYFRSEESILNALRVVKRNLTLQEFEDRGLFVFYTEDNEPCVYEDILKDYIDNFDWYFNQYKNHEIVLRKIEKESLTYLTKIECMYYLMCFGKRLDNILKELDSINNTYKKEDIDNYIYKCKYPYDKKRSYELMTKKEVIEFLNITETEYIQLKVNSLLKEKKIENCIYYFEKQYIEENALFLVKYLEMNNDKIYENLYNLQKQGICIVDNIKNMLSYMYDMYKKWPLFEEKTVDGIIYWYDVT